jgi:ribosomal protein S18 acetylase RimI-like enzyme
MSPSTPPAVSPDAQVTGTIRVRHATPADVPALTGVLVRAFAADPLVAWAVRPDARRGDAHRRLFDLFLRRLTLPHGEVYTTTDLRGAALWTPPGTWRQGLWEQVAHLPDWLAIVGPRRVRRVFGPVDGLLRRHPHRPHFYLPILGVDPAVQGRGIGGALVQPVLTRCDREGVPAYLENTNRRNLAFYERRGFRVVAELALASGGPTVWPMWREPSAGHRGPS